MKDPEIIVIDKGVAYGYSRCEWNLAWILVGLIGFVTGLLIG